MNILKTPFKIEIGNIKDAIKSSFSVISSRT